MKLKERRNFQVINRIRDYLMESDKDIGVWLDGEFFKSIAKEFTDEEVNYSIRYLTGKGYFEYHKNDKSHFTLTSLGYDEWLFASGAIDEKKIFVSYAIEDRILASRLKICLEELGYDVFLAHEDIEPTAQWRDKIISDLKTASIFIALMTKKYIRKQYTEQECGFALALNKRILSLRVGIKSIDMGFCSEFQGATFKQGDEEKIFEFCQKQLK